MILKLMLGGNDENGEPLTQDDPRKPYRIIGDVGEVTHKCLDTGEISIDVEYKSPVRGLMMESFVLYDHAWLMNDAGKTVQPFYPSKPRS